MDGMHVRLPAAVPNKCLLGTHHHTCHVPANPTSPLTVNCYMQSGSGDFHSGFS